MTQIKKLIAQMFSKKSIKVWSVFLIFGFVFVAQTYAQTWDSETTINTFSYYIHILLSIMSWIWIILANLAGKLMTNDILYWSFLHLDASLWTLWNIMKNFANFALWFFVLFAIVKNVVSWPFGKGNAERSPINTIKKTLIAGVIIQSSWFLMWAVVDISTIMTSAIWAFPSQFIASNQEFQWSINKNIKSLSKNKITFDPKSDEHIVKIESKEDYNPDDDEIKKLLDTITPSYDSVSGPLIFLWLSVFNFNDFENFGTVGNAETWIDEWWDLFLSLWLSALILVFFTLMMFFIFMFNLFRLIMLWILIPLLPIVVLLNVFKITDKLGWWKWMDLSKFMSPKTIFMLVFKPVIMVWALSLILVILVMMKSIIAGDKESKIIMEDQGNMVIESRKESGGDYYTSTMKSDGIFEFSMTGVKDTFADIIVYFFGLFLIFFLVKMVVSIKTGISFIDNSLENTFKSFEGILTNLPVIPIAGWVWISSMKDAFSSSNVSGMATRMAWIDIAQQQALLGMDKTFSWLNTSIDRDAWISSAVAAGKNLGYKNYTDMTKSKDFNDKLHERNTTKSKINSNFAISQKDIDEAFAGNTKTTDRIKENPPLEPVPTEQKPE
jgi:hypothetical protein